MVKTDIDVDGFSFNESTKTMTSYLSGVENNEENQVIIPTQISGIHVLHIGNLAFESCNLTSITFVEGSKVETIGSMAFANNLASTGAFTLPDSMTSIDSHSFLNTCLEQVYFGATRDELGLSDDSGVGLGRFEERYARLTGTASGFASGTVLETALVFSDCTDYSDKTMLVLGDGILKVFYPEHSGFDGETDLVIPEVVTSIGTPICHN